MTVTSMANTSSIKSGVVAGKILQVVSTTKTDTYAISGLASGAISSAVVTGLTAAITPVATNSKVLIRVSVHIASADGNVDGFGGFVFRRDSTAIGVPDTAGSRPAVSAQGGSFGNNGADMVLMTHEFEDSPSSTSEIVYGISLHNPSSSTSGAFVNRSQTDVDSSRFARTISTITVMEVAG